jgi:hypothetical protein
MDEESGFVRENASLESRLEIEHLIIENSRHDVDAAPCVFKQPFVDQALQVSTQDPGLGNLRGRYCAVIVVHHLKYLIRIRHGCSPPIEHLREEAIDFRAPYYAKRVRESQFFGVRW